MKTKNRSIDQIVEEQVKRWEILHSEKSKKEDDVTVITVSREPGSGGTELAKKLAETLGFDYFHKELILKMAESADTSGQILETLDEKAMNVLEDWIESLVNTRHLWPDQYLKHFMKIMGTIAKHGKSVIVGRGANFALPPKNLFRVMVIAPEKSRIKAIAEKFDISDEEAGQRMALTQSDRKAFIRKLFNADINDPLNYDLVINTEILEIEAGIGAIIGGLGKK